MEVLGAVASNAGDEFHEIWALRKAISILDRSNPLTAITLEGVASSTGTTSDSAQWDGVDCALYYGGTTIEDADKIDLIQLKYTVTQLNVSWTVTKFTQSSAKTGNNSVARRLGLAYNGAIKGKSKDYISNNVTITLLTNQNINADLIEKIEEGGKGLSSPELDQIQKATGLNKTAFKSFCQSLNLSGGEPANAHLKSDVVRAIAAISDTEVSGIVSQLRLKITEMMVPPASRSPITWETVVSWLGAGELHAIYPCPSELEESTPIPRQVTKDLADAVKKNNFVYLEGSGGCGKTTTIQALQSELPKGSEVIIFDCYGAGRYLDQSRTRHRPVEVFTQMANEIAQRFSLPIFLPYKENPNISASFRRRIEMASNVLRVDNPEAFLVLVMDAADNSVFAASKTTPPQASALHEFVTFSELPANVRLLVSARTSRLPSLKLPALATSVKCSPFLPNETEDLINQRWPHAPADEITQFHHLSNGVPRVQVTTIAAAASIVDACDLLRPNGKNLDDLFQAVLHQSSVKMGGDGTLDQFCGALSVLSTPAPADLLAKLCGESLHFVQEVCDDLTPNVRLSAGGFEFANEDFEDFIRRTGQPHHDSKVQEAAEELFKARHTSAYAAMHVGNLLVQSGRHEDLFLLIDEKDSTRIISDKLERKRTDLQRLQAAISVATRKGDQVQAGKVILIGAEAVRSEDKVFNLLINNFDLSAQFSETSIRQEVLWESERRQYHGQILCQLSKKASETPQNHPISREWSRLALHWIRERASGFEDTPNDYHNWKLDDADVVAHAYARANVTGWENAYSIATSWSPDRLHIPVLAGMLDLAIKRSGPDKAKIVRDNIPLDARWIATVALIRCGLTFDTTELNQEVSSLLNADWDFSDDRDVYGTAPSRGQVVIDQLLFFIEHCLRKGCDRENLLALTERTWPQKKRSASNTAMRLGREVDFTIRAGLIESEANAEPWHIDKIFNIDRDIFKRADGDSSEEAGKKNKQKELVEEFERKVDSFIKFYAALMNPDFENPGNSENTLENLAGIISASTWHVERNWELQSIRSICCERIADRYADSRLTIDNALIGMKGVFSNKVNFGELIFNGVNRLLFKSEAFDPVLAEISTFAEAIFSDTGPANGRSDSLLAISRLILPNSIDDAKWYFDASIKLLEEIDIEAIDQIYFLTNSSKKFHGHESLGREFCLSLAPLFEHSALVLGGEDHFPRSEIIKSLARLSFKDTLPIFGMWTDNDLFSSKLYFDDLILSGLNSGNIDSIDATCLNIFISDDGLSLMQEALACSSGLGNSELSQLAHEYSKRISLLRDPKLISSNTKILTEYCRSHKIDLDTISEATRLCDFFESNSVLLEDDGREEERPRPNKSFNAKRNSPLDLTQFDPTKPDDLLRAIEAERANGRYDAELLLSDFRKHRIAPGDRVAHLNALLELCDTADYPPRFLDSIINAVQAWQNPAVAQWSAQMLPALIENRAEWLVRYGWTQPNYFEPLSLAANVDDYAKAALILRAVERSSTQLSSASLFQYASFLLLALPTEEAKDLLKWYILRFRSAQLNGSGAKIVVNDFDTRVDYTNSNVSMARFIYRYLGDADVQVRWRGAHALRAFCRFNRRPIFEAILNAVDVRYDFDFASDHAPFHWLTARVWLAITIARIGSEKPEIVSQAAGQIFDVAQAEPPHLLVQHYLRRGLQNAALHHPLSAISINEVDALCEPASLSAQKRSERTFHRYSVEERAKTRFQFDPMDVLPYWYAHAVEAFQDVSNDEFLTVADRWICDHWGGHDKSTHWDEEPRKARLHGEDSYAGHGSYPRFERHSMYLQWHAMFVAAAELLFSRTVVLSEEGKSELVDFLERWDTTRADIWLSDLRQPKPLELSLWQKIPVESDEWLDRVPNEFFAQKIQSGSRIVLSASYDTSNHRYGSKNGAEFVEVDSALVNPNVANSLLSSLQITTNYYDFHIPTENNFYEDYESKDKYDVQFSLIDSTNNPGQYRDIGFDKHDPLNFGCTNIRALPHEDLERAAVSAGLASRSQPQSSIENALALYHSWAELSDSTSDRERRQISGQFSNGYVLIAELEVIVMCLREIGKDLIFTVRLRRERGDEYGQYKREDSRRTHYGRVDPAP